MISPALRARASYMPKYVPDANCVLWLPGQDDPQSATIRDRSGNGNNGTIDGATWVRTGKGLWVLFYDGAGDANDIVTVADAASIQNIFDGGGTVEAWIDVATSGEANAGIIVSKLWMFFTRAGINLHFRHPFSTTEGMWETVLNPVTANERTHVAITYDNGDVANNPILYVNGEAVAFPQAQAPVGVRTTDVGTDLTVGNTPAKSQTLDGYEGLTKAFNAILSAQQIGSHRRHERDLFGV